MSGANSAARRSVPSVAATQVEFISTPLPAWAWCCAALFAIAVAAISSWIAADAPFSMRPTSVSQLVDGAHDDQAHVAARVLAGDASDADVIVYGSSSAREALWPEAALEAAVQDLRGERLAIVTLTSSAQNPIEALFLATLRPARPGQLYVLVVGFGTVRASNVFERLAHGAFLVPPLALLDDDRYAALVPREWTSTSGRWLMRWYALRQWSQRQIRFGFRSWILRELYGIGVAPYDVYRYDGIGSTKVPDRTLQVNGTRHALKVDFTEKIDAFSRTLDALAEYVHDRGSELAIVTAPDFAHGLRETLPAEHARFLSELGTLATRRGVAVFDWNTTIDWEPADSVDATHASAAGRRKWSTALVGWLARRVPMN